MIKNISFIAKHVKKANYSFTTIDFQNNRDKNSDLSSTFKQNLSNDEPNRTQQIKEVPSWFDKLTEATNQNKLDESAKFTNFRVTDCKKELNEFSKSDKEKIINKIIEQHKQNLTHEIIDEHWNELINVSNFNELSLLVRDMVKKSEKQNKKELENFKRIKYDRKKNEMKRVECIDLSESSDKINDYFRKQFMNKLIAEQTNPRINYIPSILFDFRFENNIANNNYVNTIHQQFKDVIALNLKSNDPFKLKFYNYKQNTNIDKCFKAENFFNLNFIDTHDNSYLDYFAKEDLIYLSPDSRNIMDEYDPTKTYIIGSIIDDGKETFKYASFTQAKKDGIKCLQLPLDKFLKMNIKKKNLNLNRVFKIMLCLNSGMEMKHALINSIPFHLIDSVIDKSIEKDFILYSENRKAFDAKKLKKEFFTDNFIKQNLMNSSVYVNRIKKYKP